MKRRSWLLVVASLVFSLVMVTSVASAPTPPTAWTHTTVEGTDDVGIDVNVAMNSANGQIFISYYDMTNTALRAAAYVVQGGNCGDGEWQCANVAGGPRTGTDVGGQNDIAVHPFTGYPAVAYYDRTNNRLMYAISSCQGVNCPWEYHEVDSTSALFTSMGMYPSLEFGSDNIPRIAYWYNNSFSNDDELRYAEYVGAGGNCGSGEWQCTTVEAGFGYGHSPSLELTRASAPYDNPYIASYDAENGDLRYAWYLGTGTGNCGASNWYCMVIDSVGDVGAYPAFTAAFGGGTFPAIAYLDRDIGRLKIARSADVGGTGNCGGGNWDCSPIYQTGGDNGETVASGASRVPGGHPYFVFGCPGCFGNGILTVQHVGTGGNCADPAYKCILVASDPINLHDRSQYADVVLSGANMPTIVYFDVDDGDVRVAKQRYSMYLPVALGE